MRCIGTLDESHGGYARLMKGLYMVTLSPVTCLGSMASGSARCKGARDGHPDPLKDPKKWNPLIIP